MKNAAFIGVILRDSKNYDFGDQKPVNNSTGNLERKSVMPMPSVLNGVIHEKEKLE